MHGNEPLPLVGMLRVGEFICPVTHYALISTQDCESGPNEFESVKIFHKAVQDLNQTVGSDAS